MLEDSKSQIKNSSSELQLRDFIDNTNIRLINLEQFQKIISYFIEKNSESGVEIRKLLSILNFFVNSNCEDFQKLIVNDLLKFNEKLIQLLIKNLSGDTNTIESILRIIRSLSIKNLFVLANFSAFLDNIHNFLINNLCIQYVLTILIHIDVIINKNHQVEKQKIFFELVERFENINNQKLAIDFLKFFCQISENNAIVCETLYSHKIFKSLSRFLRIKDNLTNVYAFSLMVNISSQIKNDESRSQLFYSISILLDLIRGEKSKESKFEIFKVLKRILENFPEFHYQMVNLEGIELCYSELKSMYTKEKCEEIEEKFRNSKNKKQDYKYIKIDLSEDNPNEINKYSALHYKILLTQCLAISSNELNQARMKIIHSREIAYAFDLLNQNSISGQIAISQLVLSLSRLVTKCEKLLLKEHDILNLLFQFSNSKNHILKDNSTRSLGNMLLDNSGQTTQELTQYLNRLFELLENEDNNEILYNIVCSIKNLVYTSTNNKEVKKFLVMKTNIDKLFDLFKTSNEKIKEQILIIFRSLVHKSADVIDEIYSVCKENFDSLISDNLNSNNSSFILNSLYLIYNLSSEDNKEREIIFRRPIISKILELVDNDEEKIRLVCLLIINNLISQGNQISKEKTLEILKEMEFLKRFEEYLAKRNKIQGEEKIYLSFIISSLRLSK